jgi:hypothetical protein
MGRGTLLQQIKKVFNRTIKKLHPSMQKYQCHAEEAPPKTPFKKIFFRAAFHQK